MYKFPSFIKYFAQNEISITTNRKKSEINDLKEFDMEFLRKTRVYKTR